MVFVKCALQVALSSAGSLRVTLHNGARHGDCIKYIAQHIANYSYEHIHLPPHESKMLGSVFLVVPSLLVKKKCDNRLIVNVGVDSNERSNEDALRKYQIWDGHSQDRYV